METKVKKQFNGFVSIRDYIIEKCLTKHEDLIIDFKGDIMTVPLESMKNTFQLHKRKFKSKFKDEYYELYDFKFIPDSEMKTIKAEGSKQGILF